MSTILRVPKLYFILITYFEYNDYLLYLLLIICYIIIIPVVTYKWLQVENSKHMCYQAQLIINKLCTHY